MTHLKNKTKLFELVKIGSLLLRNRGVVPAMWTNLANRDGTASEHLKDYLAARAAGGFGLIITEDAAISRYGRSVPTQLGIWEDKFIPGLRDSADEIHKRGAKVAVQLFHAGRQTVWGIEGQPAAAPSAISCPRSKTTPRELSIYEIEELEKQFAQAARRAREAGVDAVEIRGTHGYLVAKFMSSYSNHRTNAYGGNPVGLLQFPIAIIQKIREGVGLDYPILLRLSGDERVSGGRTINERKVMIPFLEQEGRTGGIR